MLQLAQIGYLYNMSCGREMSMFRSEDSSSKVAAFLVATDVD